MVPVGTSVGKERSWRASSLVSSWLGYCWAGSAPGSAGFFRWTDASMLEAHTTTVRRLARAQDLVANRCARCVRLFPDSFGATFLRLGEAAAIFMAPELIALALSIVGIVVALRPPTTAGRHRTSHLSGPA